MKLIDKDAVVAEIDRIQNEFLDRNGNFDSSENQGAYMALDRLDSFLDTLEVKEVNLTKELDSFLDKKGVWEINGDLQYHNGDLFCHTYDLEKVAEHFFELGAQTASGTDRK